MTFRDERPEAGRHAHHDRLLIAAHAAGDLAGRELERATGLLAQCADCRALGDELRAIRSTTNQLPAAVRPAKLDFRLTPAKAAELDRGRGWRRLLRPFGRGSTSARPLAAAFTTLGLAGLLLAAMPGFLGGTYFLGGAGGAAPADVRQETDSQTPASAPDPDDLSGGESNTPGSGSEYMTDGVGRDTAGGEATEPPGRTLGGSQGGASQAPTEAPEDVLAFQVDDDAPLQPSPLVLLSIGFLGAGIGLILLRLAARHLD